MHPPLGDMAQYTAALDRAALALRSAVLASDHEQAALRSAEYTEAVAQYWKQLPNRERAASLLPKLSLELLNWAREMTTMQQALAAQQLAIVENASRYQTARVRYLRSAALEAQP
jgi:hypothetical protein